MKKSLITTIAVAMLVVGVVRWEPAAQPAKAESTTKDAALDPQLAAKRQAMIDAARQTYVAIQDGYNAGTEPFNELYAWSSYIRSAEVRAADSKQQVLKAYQEHVDRMRGIHAKVKALHAQGSRGGEESKYRASEFYLAEAELLLLEAKGQ